MNEKILNKIYAKNIKYYRFKMGWTQEHLAEKASLEINTIRGIENGLRSASPKTTCKIVNALKIKPKDLYDESILTYNLPNKITDFKRNTNNLK